LQVPQLADVARSTNDTNASTKFEVNLDVQRAVRVFVIPKHNLSTAAQYRIRGSNTAGVFTSPVYDTGWLDVWGVVYPPFTLPWGHPSWWTLQLSAEDAEGYNIGLIHVAPDDQIAQYWLFEFDDTTNPDGYVELARLHMSQGWQPSINASYGLQIGWETDTTSERSLGSVDYFDRRDPRRVVQMQFDNLPIDEVMVQAFEAYRRLGLDVQLVFILDPDDTANLHRRSFLATIKKMSSITYPYVGRGSVPFELKEVL